jgi:peptide/nickel transport system substrate-binding protein
MQDYWRRFTENRLNRRRALIGTGAGALGAAFLAACGGGGSDSGKQASNSKDKSGLIYEPEDTSSQAKPGGVIRYPYTTDILTWDALQSNSASTVNDVSVFTYPRLVKYTLTKYPKPNEGGVEGDAMESFEISPDKLTYTFKLREGMKWEAKAPTSGRTIDTQDIVFSWNKFAKVNASAANLAYNATTAPSAPIESVAAPDNRTVVFKLKTPEAALMTLLAGWDQLYVMPRESDGGFDPRNEVRGYGPWILDEYRPSAFINWKKNPDYYVKGRPYPDRLERPLVSEFAARLSQFKAGNINHDVVEQSQQDVVQLKKDQPQTLLILGAGGYGKNYNPVTSAHINFGYEGDSKFKDVRVRQAISMALDREAFTDFAENRAAFAADGLDNSVAMNSSLSPAWIGYWLDPANEKEFGPNAKYLQHNVAEAKKLLAAAGFPNGFEFDFHHCNNNYGAVYLRTPEVYAGMFQEIGLKPKLNGIPYATWLPQYHYGYIPATYMSGQTKGFNGIGIMAERQRYTPAFSIYGLLHPEGDAYHGVTPDGREPLKGDPKLNDMLARMRQETDKEKAKEGMKEVQRYVAQQAYHVPKPSNSIPFTVWWPAIGNVGAFTSSPVGANRWAEHNLAWYIDTTKPPLGRS